MSHCLNTHMQHASRSCLPLVRLLLDAVCDVALELVVDTAGLARVPRSRLKGYRGRTVWRQLKVEGVRVGAQLAEEAFLEGDTPATKAV